MSFYRTSKFDDFIFRLLSIEFKKRQQRYKRTLKIYKRLSTRFARKELLYQKIIADLNEKLNAKLSTLPESDLGTTPPIEHYIACYMYKTSLGKQIVRIVHSQNANIEDYDNTIKKFAEENQANLRKSRHESMDQNRWLNGAVKFLHKKCGNLIASWNKVKAQDPYVFYGLRVVTTITTTIVGFLSKDEIRQKYESDLGANTIHLHKVNFIDVYDAIDRCFTPDDKIQTRIATIVDTLIAGPVKF